MLTYILEVTLCWSIFYTIFFVALRKLTFFRVNRWYLLTSLVIGMLIPLLKNLEFNFYQEDVAEIAPLVYVIKDAPAQIAISVTESTTDWNIVLFNMLLFVYLIGLTFFTSRLLRGLWTIRKLFLAGNKSVQKNYTLITTSEDHLPFSFFKYVFISKTIPLKEEYDQIIRHEISHVNGRHSIDIILIELINVAWWFNPLIYLYKTAIRQTHEYLADHAVLENTSRKIYGTLLLKQSLSGLQIALTHQFFHSHIKKRINMMYQKKSGQSAWLKYTLALPVLLLLFIVFSGYNQSSYSSSQFAEDINFFCDGDKGSMFPARLYVNEPTYNQSSQSGLNTKYPDELRALINNYKPKKYPAVIIDGKLIQENLRDYIDPDRDIQSAELTVYSPEYAKEQFGEIAKHGAIEFKNIQQEGIQSRSIITAISPLGNDILKQLEEAYKDAPGFPKEVNVQKVLLVYNNLRAKYKDELSDLRKLFISFLNSKEIDYRYNKDGLIEGLSLKDGLSNIDQSNIPLILYEGRKIEFPSSKAAKNYQDQFTGLEIISGEEGYQKYGQVAKHRNVVFNHIKSDGYLLRTNNEESYVYHNGLEWMHRYSSPTAGNITIIIRDKKFKDVWQKEYYKSDRVIEMPVSQYEIPKGLFQISIVSSFSGRLDGAMIRLEKPKKFKSIDRTPYLNPILINGEYFYDREEAQQHLKRVYEEDMIWTDTFPLKDPRFHGVSGNIQDAELSNSKYENALIILDGKEIGRGYDEMPDFEEVEISRFELMEDTAAIERFGEKGKDGVILLTSKEMTKQPLIILDDSHRIRGEVNKLPYNLEPKDIEKVDVIKGEEALELYGEEGRNGVVLITTKEMIFGESSEGENDHEKSPTISVYGNRDKKNLEKVLLVIDGKNYGRKNLNEQEMEDIIDIDDINSISVYKGEKAIEKFGQDGQNGVIEIFTNSYDQNRIDKTKTGKTELLILFEGKAREFNKLNSIFKEKDKYNGIEIHQGEKAIQKFLEIGPMPGRKKSKRFKGLFKDHNYKTVFNYFKSPFLEETITNHYTIKISQIKEKKLKLEYHSDKNEQVDFIFSAKAGEKDIRPFSKHKGSHIIELNMSELPRTGFVMSFYPESMGGGFDSKVYRLENNKLVSDHQALDEWRGIIQKDEKIVEYDTVIVFDPETYTESIRYIERLPQEEISNMKSKETDNSKLDTFVIFDPEDFSEKFYVLPSPDTVEQYTFDNKKNQFITTTITSGHQFDKEGKPYVVYDTSITVQSTREYIERQSEESKVKMAVVQNVLSYRNNLEPKHTADFLTRTEGVNLSAFKNDQEQIEISYESPNNGKVTFYIHDILGKMISQRSINHQAKVSNLYFDVEEKLTRMIVVTAAQEGKISSVKLIIP